MCSPQDLYLDLVAGCLTRTLHAERYRPVTPLHGTWRRLAHAPIRGILATAGLEVVRPISIDPNARAVGRDQPPEAETMIGLQRLDNLRRCVLSVLRDHVPGDLIETGVWRGGATIFMRAVLKAYGDSERLVWVADSFRGLPPPDEEAYPADVGDTFWKRHDLAVSLEEVKANFDRYGLLDGQVRFLPGWFRDTLPTAAIERLAVLRLDGDLYQSTMEALESLYPKLSIGGYVIVDDYGAVPACKAAVEDFRERRGVTEKLEHVDWTGVFWQRAH